MRKCSESISLFTASIVANVWLLADREGRRFLVDTGFPAERNTLRRSFRGNRIRRRGDITAVLLTHRHCDHAGNADWIRHRLGCPIVCHENDARILAGRQATPPLKRGIGRFYDEICCFVEDRFPAQLEVDDAFGIGPWKYGFHIYPAFGHTEGSVLIYHEPTRTLFSGDALLSGIPPFRVRERFFLAVPAYSVDAAACHRHTLEFLKDPPPVAQLCSGHGPFVHEDTARKLQRFYERNASRGRTGRLPGA